MSLLNCLIAEAHFINEACRYYHEEFNECVRFNKTKEVNRVREKMNELEGKKIDLLIEIEELRKQHEEK